ncbi:twin transmembrane helix small protein [Azospirillum sp. sgz302134]
MNELFAILLILALGAVVASLFIGLFFMARGGQGDSRKSNKAMRLRVMFQGVALVLFLLAMLTQA